MVDAVCKQLSNRPLYTDVLGDLSVQHQHAVGGSRHSRQYRKRCREQTEQETQPLAYRHAVDPHLKQYQDIMSTPIPWNGSVEENQWNAERRERQLHALRAAVLAVTDQHAPNLIIPEHSSERTAHAMAAAATTPDSPARGCPLCLSNPNGVCESCQNVMYEHTLNARYMMHHTIGMSRNHTATATTAAPASSTATNTATAADTTNTTTVDAHDDDEEYFHHPPVVTMPALDEPGQEDHHQSLMMPPNTPAASTPSAAPSGGGGGPSPSSASTVAVGESGRSSSVTMYQRRAQFRLAMSAFQGRPSRPVPDAVIDDIRQQIEGARHLIQMDESEPLKRYARVTRVHVLCILRSNGSNRYSRWYRESHHIHQRITHQPPPDISDIEPTMLFVLFRLPSPPSPGRKADQRLCSFTEPCDRPFFFVGVTVDDFPYHSLGDYKL